VNKHHEDEHNMFSSLAGQATVGTCQFSSVTRFEIAANVEAQSGAQIFWWVLIAVLVSAVTLTLLINMLTRNSNSC